MLNFKILSESLEELSDRELQVQLWLGHNTENLMSSFEEAVCGAFDDAHLARAMETGYLVQNFDKEICDNVRRLNKLIGFIPQDQPADAIIDHPKMVEIRTVAGELRELLRGRNKGTGTPEFPRKT